MQYSIVIPAHNEEDGLSWLAPRLPAGVPIIVVDDGSTDGTGVWAIRLGEPEDFNLRGIKITHKRRRGCGAALKTGIAAAQTDVVVIMDADGQHDPDDIRRFVEILPDYDMVVGERGRKWKQPLHRRLAKWFLTRVASWIAEAKVKDLTCGFRAFRRSDMERFLHLLPDGHSFMATSTVAYLRAGLSIGHVRILPRPRVGGESKVRMGDGPRTAFLLLRLALLFAPMRVFGSLAVGLGITGLAYALWGFFTIFHLPAVALLLLLSSIVVLAFAMLADLFAIVARRD